VPTASRFFEQPLAEQVLENALPDEVHDTPFPPGCQDFSSLAQPVDKALFSPRLFGWMNNINRCAPSAVPMPNNSTCDA
jgi:hypothetical protein